MQNLVSPTLRVQPERNTVVADSTKLRGSIQYPVSAEHERGIRQPSIRETCELGDNGDAPPIRFNPNPRPPPTAAAVGCAPSLLCGAINAAITRLNQTRRKRKL